MARYSMNTVRARSCPSLRHLHSSWLTGAAAIPGALIVQMEDNIYAYAVPWGAGRALGILRGWSAQGADVGKLWPRLRRYLGASVRVEVAEPAVDLVPALRASLEAA